MIVRKSQVELNSEVEGEEGASTGGRKRDRQETERKLREAAVQVFSQYGYDAATTKLVAQTAGINEALINRYFNGKNGLLLAVIEEYVNEENARNIDYPACETFEEEIRQFCNRRIAEARIAERGHIMRIVTSRVAVDAELRESLVKQLPIRKADPRLLERLERLKSLGKIPKDADCELIAHTISGQIFSNMIFGHLIFGVSLKEVRENIDHFIKIYTRGLLLES